MFIEFNPGIFGSLMLLAYIANVLTAAYRNRPIDADRLLLRAPIVSLLATLVYAPVTMLATSYVGMAALVYIALKDYTFGDARKYLTA